MMGRTHVESAFAASLATAVLAGTGTLAPALASAQISAGAALLPDLDHGSSSATRIAGPASRWLSNRLQTLSQWAYDRTANRADERQGGDGTHRHLTHTIPFALVTGLTVGLVCLATPLAALIVYGLSTVLAVDRLGTSGLVLATAGAVPFGTTLITQPELLSWQTGAAVTLGMLVHDLGDSATLSGDPLGWPLRIRGQRWRDLKPLGRFSFRTNSRAENYLVSPVLVGVCAGCAGYLAGLGEHLALAFTNLGWPIGPTTAVCLLGLATAIIRPFGPVHRANKHARKVLRQLRRWSRTGRRRLRLL